MLKVGETAPDFNLPDQTGRARTLEDLLGDGRLLLYFYPADFSPVCTKQACTLRDEHDRLLDDGTRVAGISTQSVGTHSRFAARFDLPFPVLADPDKSVCRAYGVLGPLGMWTNRVSYLIGPDRKILDSVRSGLFLGKHWELIRDR
ncbi:MAG: peroxiredoxin [Phycisphaerales bacterium]|nr:peroxiredoxin [Planctomycetota bacterium]MCH8507659.1 peroxiredoxin [Phycisphaerales bacterium]